MKSVVFERSVRIERPVEDVFAWHERPGALERLTPPWQRLQVIERHGGIRDGARVVVRMKLGPARMRWTLEHRDYVPHVQFRDVQRSGPFAHWEHLHAFEPAGPTASVLIDRIQYALPVGGGLFGGARYVDSELARLFAYRHALTRADLEVEPAAAPGTVMISGASGLLGRALVSYLRTQGWRVYRLVRRGPRAPDEVEWSPAEGRVEWPDATIDAVVHLAGENIAAGRWTAARKRALLASRIDGTRAIVAALLCAPRRPRVLVSASAAGIYGDTGERQSPETAVAGDDFLARVCAAWEAETDPAREAGVRTVLLRSGVVLSPDGGALAKLLPVFRAGLGGPLGDGQQWMSWLGRDDWLDVCRRALVDATMAGPVNAVSPHPVRNGEFVATLARVLRRPAWLRVPRFAMRLALGELADAALLASNRLDPAVLRACGHTFRTPTLEQALRHVLGR